MMHEHEDHDQAIARLEELTNNFELPEGACGSWTRLYALAKEMVDDLKDHIHLENEILFPPRFGFLRIDVNQGRLNVQTACSLIPC